MIIPGMNWVNPIANATKTLLETGSAKLLHLYVNNWVPECQPFVGDLTEASFPGYDPIDITEGWLGPVVADGVATLTYPPQVFTRAANGAPQTVYGYYVTGEDGDLLWVEPAVEPVTLTVGGQIYVVVPVWQTSMWNLDPCPL